MNIAEDDLFLDFVTQTKIYGFEVMGDIAKEKLVGFELKKNLSIHYRDRSLIDKLAVTAARSKIYDLIKVDYVVKDVNLVQGGSSWKRPPRSSSRRSPVTTGCSESSCSLPPRSTRRSRRSITRPGCTNSYTAAESESVLSSSLRQNHTVQLARKTKTFVFNGLDGDGFDQVINPVVIEPVVQFTLHLKVKYEIEQTKAK